MEEMLGGDYWKEQSIQEQTFENLSYELLHSQGNASTPIVFTNDYNSELGIFLFPWKRSTKCTYKRKYCRKTYHI